MHWPATRNSIVGDLPTGIGWEKFYREYGGVICAFAQFKGLDPHSAQDVLQETVMVLIRELPKFKYEPEKAKFRTWLKTILRHQITEARRRRRDDRNISGDVPDENGATFLEQLVLEFDSGELDDDEKAWRKAVFAQAWSRIQDGGDFEPATIEVFLALMNGTPVKKLCEATGLEPNVIYAKKHRIKQRLFQEIKAIGEDPLPGSKPTEVM